MVFRHSVTEKLHKHDKLFSDPRNIALQHHQSHSVYLSNTSPPLSLASPTSKQHQHHDCTSWQLTQKHEYSSWSIVRYVSKKNNCVLPTSLELRRKQYLQQLDFSAHAKNMIACKPEATIFGGCNQSKFGREERLGFSTVATTTDCRRKMKPELSH